MTTLRLTELSRFRSTVCPGASARRTGARARRRAPWCAVTAGLALLAGILPAPALGQQRPLVTEDPETVGAGRVLVEGGIAYSRDMPYPVSGLEGHLLRVPLLGFSIGLSSIAEIQVDGVSFGRLDITGRADAPLAGMVTATGDSTSSVEDLTVGTKIRIVPEGVSRPSLGLRFATRLPNASNESGIGLDTTDFFASLLVAKTVQSVRVVTNLGLGILADPTRGDRQNDVLTYGVSFARALTQAAEVVGEVNGHIDTRAGDAPPGTDSRSLVRMGARYTIGSVRADAALLVGVTARDPGIGFAAGLTYVFSAFAIP